MFDELSGKLDAIFRELRGQGRLTEDNIRNAMRDIRRSLLEADVNYRVAKQFIVAVQERALGREVISSITPGQMIVKIVHDQLVELLGSTAADIPRKGSPEIFILCGLQGSGKTTTVAKLALWLNANGRHTLVSSVDVHRPAAIDQIRILAEKNNIAFHRHADGSEPIGIARGALKDVQEGTFDTLIMDTAGRLHVDDEMMRELQSVIEVIQPHHIIFVADGMTGQDAVTAVEGFMRYVSFDGVILTKMDGDARGGAALSLRETTGKPILFVGTGERVNAFERFHPDRFANRILGMGDVVTLVERAQEVMDQEKARELQEKIISEGLSLEDFLDQLHQVKRMGSLDQILGLIPGVGKVMRNIHVDDRDLKHIEAIILSMTPEERRKPDLIDGSRRRRIAFGSGTTVQEVNNLLRQFQSMRKMMKQMTRFGGKMNGLPVPGMPI